MQVCHPRKCSNRDFLRAGLYQTLRDCSAGDQLLAPHWRRQALSCCSFRQEGRALQERGTSDEGSA